MAAALGSVETPDLIEVALVEIAKFRRGNDTVLTSYTYICNYTWQSARV